MTHFATNAETISLGMFPSDIARISEHLPDTHQSQFLKTQVSSHAENVSIDYDRYASAFNQAFFLRNYLKCALYLRSLPSNPLAHVHSVVDLGGGAGPFSLAARHFDSRIDTLVVDKSRAQLSQAVRLSIAHGLRHINKTAYADMVQLRIEPNIIRILSYSICENVHQLECDPALRSTIFGNQCIVVDYPHIVRKAAWIASRFGGQARHMVFARHTLCTKLTKLLGQANITYGGVCIESTCPQ